MQTVGQAAGWPSCSLLLVLLVLHSRDMGWERAACQLAWMICTRLAGQAKQAQLKSVPTNSLAPYLAQHINHGAEGEPLRDLFPCKNANKRMSVA